MLDLIRISYVYIYTHFVPYLVIIGKCDNLDFSFNHWPNTLCCYSNNAALRNTDIFGRWQLWQTILIYMIVHQNITITIGNFFLYHKVFQFYHCNTVLATDGSRQVNNAINNVCNIFRFIHEYIKESTNVIVNILHSNYYRVIYTVPLNSKKNWHSALNLFRHQITKRTRIFWHILVSPGGEL